MKSELKNVRNQIANRGLSEFEVRKHSDELQILWERLEQIKTEHNQAKAKALADIDAKYLPLIVEIENQYAFLLKLSA